MGTPVPFTNMSRLMATSIFSGQVRNWNEFGSATDLPVVVCLRHAGSGTAATLDAAVMRGDFGLLSEEVNATSSAYTDGISPLVWFNKGTTEELNCVASQPGAVGYADADKTGANIALMTYQGVAPSNSTIKNGQYDFWSAQYLYSKETGATDAIIDALVAFASDEAHMDATQKLFWAAQDAMKWEKGTDFSYPQRKAGN
nr:hypothetical protein [Desulfobacula sp.]